MVHGMTDPVHAPTSFDAVYLSPHLDDVILSCGGQIAEQTAHGASVLVVTLAAGDPVATLSPFARELHEQWGLPEDVAARRAEDNRAVEQVGADVRHETTPDAIYRVRADDGAVLYPSLTAVFGAVHPDDPARAAWVKAVSCLPPTNAVYAPLAIGGHVDHQLVRQVAETVFASKLAYYEDFPYAARWVDRWRATWPRWRWHQQRWPLSEQAVNARVEASLVYDSQVVMLGGSRPALANKIRRYIAARGGECLWRLRR